MDENNHLKCIENQPPAIAVDQKGYRLGYGGGDYDKYISYLFYAIL